MDARVRWIIPIFLSLLVTGCEEEAGTEDAEEMRALFEEARALDRKGDYHLALIRYEAILARHPTWMSTRLNAAMSAYDSGNYLKAAGHFEILHKFGPKDWFVIRKLIQSYERLGRKDKVNAYRAKLAELRKRKDGSALLKKYQGFTRDYMPVGTMHVIGYEFFDPGKHGRMWLFKLEDRHRRPISTFLVEASPFHNNDGRRLFYLTERQKGWMRLWYVGTEGRDYDWSRGRVMEVLQGKQRPLVVKPLPPGLTVPGIPGLEGAATRQTAGAKGKKNKEEKEDDSDD
jgi:tetratricopeptide (TPR) repeat protein